MNRPALVVAASLALGCSPALRSPRPVGALGTGARAPAGRTVPQLLEEARARFARRPDLEEVRRAESLFLAAAEADPHDIDGLYGAIQAKIWRIDHDRAADKAALATSAVDVGQWCLRRAPRSAWCDYGLALAIGVQARERRDTAIEGLKRMVEHLRRAAAAGPSVDEAGPDRVLALVLVRAPPWPMGPGDAEGALEAARRAVQLAPRYPPNVLALAEALLAAGAVGEARTAAEQGVALARARTGDPDAAEWIRDGESLRERAAEGNAPSSGSG